MKEFQEYDQLNFIENTNGIDIREEIEKYLLYWKWFLAGLCLAFLSAYFYLKYTPKQYSASAYIMIKDNLKSGISDELMAVADLGIVGTSSTNNPENEIFIIKSRKIVGKIVDSLELNVNYFVVGGSNKLEAYKSSGIKIHFINKDALYHSIDTAFIVTFSENKQLHIKNREGDILKRTKFNEIVKSNKLGDFKIVKSTSNSSNKNDVLVVVKPKKKTVSTYASRIQITALSKFSSILHLEVIDYNKLKAENILDELIKQYNLDAVIDKNIVSEKTKAFIEERLKSIGLELASIQDALKAYKTKFETSGYGSETQIMLESNSVNESNKSLLRTQLSLIEWAQYELNKELTQDEILPANLGFSNEIISKSIDEFNKLVLQKHQLERFAGDKNPNFIALNERIKALKQNLKSNLKNSKKSIQIKLSKANIEADKVKNKVDLIPFLERGMVDIERQKNIYSELYSYLLKKKEELAISLAVTVPNAKIVDVAFSSDNPVSPKKNIIYLIALGVGLLIPFIIIYIIMVLDTKIHNRKDIEDNLKIPYLSDIPNSESSDMLIVKKDTRTSTAEAFRLLRTNLSFILQKTSSTSNGQTIFVTSTVSGEGKSFVSINLAATMALTNKKVLVLGLDLRAPKITEYLNIPDRKGITNYILDEKLSLDEIKFNIPEIKNVDFISSGLVPPNPSELLLNHRVKDLLLTVKKEYDYIIVDTAPISLVTDTLLIADLADMFLYVTRANHLDKRMLIVPKTLYAEKKLPNMAIVLNGTDSRRGYGYGYGYVESEKKSFFRKLFFW